MAGIGAAWLVACVGDSVTPPPSGTDAGTNEAASDAPVADAPSCASPLQACGSKCTNVADDGENCGTCGRSCAGAACKAGQCQPQVLTDKLDSPWGVAVVDSPPVVVIAAKPSLLRCAKTGCAPASPLWTAANYPPRADTSIVVDPTNSGTAYAIVETPDAGVQVRRTGLQQSTTIPGPLNGTNVGPTTRSLHLEGNRLVVSRDPTIYTCTTGSCGTFDTVYSSLYLGDGAQAPGAPGEFVFGGGEFGTDGLRKCPRNIPCNSTELVTRAKSGAVNFTQVVGSTVFWVDQSGTKSRVLACALAGCSGNPTVIAGGEETIGGLVVDAKAAYWTATVAGVVRVCRDLVKGCGTGAVNLATGQTNPKQIGQDATAIYWVNAGVGANTGSLVKLAK